MRTEGAPHALRAGALPASAMARVARVVRCGGFWMVVFDAKKNQWKAGSWMFVMVVSYHLVMTNIAMERSTHF